MGCSDSKEVVVVKKRKKVEPEYKCRIIANDLDNFSKGIYLGKITNHPIYLAENCIDGDKKNKQLTELRGTKGKIVACGFLHDGGAVLADEIRKLVILLQKDKDACNFLILKGAPTGIAVLGIDIFVTLSDKRVQHATVVNEKIVHQDILKTDQPCLGIASFNGDIAVGFKNGEVHIFDRKCQKHGGFHLPKFEDGRLLSPTSMMQFKQTLLVTDCFAHAVVRVTPRGEPLFVYTGMTSPRGTVIDNSGNIILAGYDDLTGEKIQHLSPRGEKIPSRMSTTDVAQFPYCIAFYRKYSKLLIAGESDRCETCILQTMETSNVVSEPETDQLIDATTDAISESMSLVDIDSMLVAAAAKPRAKSPQKTLTPEVENVIIAAGVKQPYTDADADKPRVKSPEKTPSPEVEKLIVASRIKQPNKNPVADKPRVKSPDKSRTPEAENVMIATGDKQPNTYAEKMSIEDIENPQKTEENDIKQAAALTAVAHSSATDLVTTNVSRSSVGDVGKAPTPVEMTLPNEVPENTAVTVYDKTNRGVVKKVLITVREKKPKAGTDNGPITVYEKTPNGDVELRETKTGQSDENQIIEIKNNADKTSNPGSRSLSPIQA